MGLRPADFWAMTLAEWRSAVEGYTQRTQAERRRAAWSLSYQLIAAGCDAEKVTPAKLLGEPDPKPRRTRKQADGRPKVDVLYKMIRDKGGFAGAKPESGEL